jgi:tetratricopeptide (TPR) repeat protein
MNRLRPYRRQDGTVYRLQDQVIDEIITNNNWKHPVHISVTTPDENRVYKGKPLDDHLELVGMVYKLVRTQASGQIDYEKARRMYEEEFLYRGIADSTVYKAEATERLINNYSQGFLWLADTLRRAGNMEGAFGHIKAALEVLPECFDVYRYGIHLLSEMGKKDTVRIFIEQARTDRKEELFMQWGNASASLGDYDEAAYAFRSLLENYPDFRDGFRALASVYYKTRNIEEMRKLALDWQSRHPDDAEVRQLLMDLDRMPPGVNN